ncbi:MAG TPA: LuxR C-terminal-related transcriptional regulator, partial [Chitinophagaceae bacterium]|nr:LuxR C-terminal-related transcriptional regulator [Chitinophagaceae bacterium]
DIEKNNDSWEKFALHFDEVNDNYLKNLKSKFPKLTSSDLKICAYLKLNLSSKEIAQLTNISVRGVEISRYRLRKKLGLSSEQSITAFLESL